MPTSIHTYKKYLNPSDEPSPFKSFPENNIDKAHLVKLTYNFWVEQKRRYTSLWENCDPQAKKECCPVGEMIDSPGPKLNLNLSILVPTKWINISNQKLSTLRAVGHSRAPTTVCHAWPIVPSKYSCACYCSQPNRALKVVFFSYKYVGYMICTVTTVHSCLTLFPRNN